MINSGDLGTYLLLAGVTGSVISFDIWDGQPLDPEMWIPFILLGSLGFASLILAFMTLAGMMQNDYCIWTCPQPEMAAY